MTKRCTILFGLEIVLIFILIMVNMNTGSTDVSLPEVFSILISGGKGDVSSTIILDIRMPRMIAAFVLGGALALSGYLLQSFFHNPIAGPYVLGISSGAKLVVALLMVAAVKYGMVLSSVSMIIAALAGSFLATAFVIMVAKRVHNMSILIVCGVMIGYICSAVTELVVSFASDSNIVNLHTWSLGSFSSISWSQVHTFIPVVIVGLLASVLLSKIIEAFLYGEQYAISLGINVRVFRVILIGVSSLLSATVTAFAGPISFVGIAVPHIIRSTYKTSKPLVIMLASFLGGGAFCLFCDLLARYLFAPTELSISTITAIFGAPIVISLMIKRKRG